MTDFNYLFFYSNQYLYVIRFFGSRNSRYILNINFQDTEARYLPQKARAEIFDETGELIQHLSRLNELNKLFIINKFDVYFII